MMLKILKHLNIAIASGFRKSFTVNQNPQDQENHINCSEMLNAIQDRKRCNRFVTIPWRNTIPFLELIGDHFGGCTVLVATPTMAGPYVVTQRSIAWATNTPSLFSGILHMKTKVWVVSSPPIPLGLTHIRYKGMGASLMP